MARIIVSDQPELTKERTLELFRNHFSGKYEVQEGNGISRDFIVKKSDWQAVGVRFRRGANGSTVSFAGFTPSFRYRMLPLLGVVVGWPGVLAAFAVMFFALRPRRKELEEEISQFIMNARFESASHFEEVPEGVPPCHSVTHPAPLSRVGPKASNGNTVRTLILEY